MNLDTRLQALTDDFAPIDDLQERLSLVVDRARRCPPLPAETRVDAHRVLGCISAVWLTAELRDGRLHFHADADSPLVRGLVDCNAEKINDRPPAEIAASELAARLLAQGFRLARLQPEEISLETAFMRLTKGLVS